MCRQLSSLVSLFFVLTVLAVDADASEQAHDPTLADGATDVDPQVALGWWPGEGAFGHHVFLSRDFNRVFNGSLLAWKAYRTCTTYDAMGLMLGETYYWRIDEVGPCHHAPGQVWRFTVRDSIVVDSMESYSRDGNYIFDTWLDGAGDVNGVGGNGTASIVDISRGTRHRGLRAMRFGYNNSGQRRRRCYSEAQRFFNAPQNWAVGESLQLWFFGTAGNDVEPMYVALDDGNASEVLVYGTLGQDPANITKQQWQNWSIDLQDFTDVGLDISHIVSLAVGFGDRDSPVAGGVGIVYFDDITLRRTTCISESAPAGDLNGDCTLDFEDVDILAENWLVTGNVAADLYPDGSVDLTDYAVLANCWFKAQTPASP